MLWNAHKILFFFSQGVGVEIFLTSPHILTRPSNRERRHAKVSRDHHSNERQFKAFTGLSQQAFARLLIEFTHSLEAVRQRRYRQQQDARRRHPGGGRKGALSTPELKLFFILFYLKNYPTFDVLGGLFDLSPGKAEDNVRKWLPLLQQAEKRLHVLPRRHFKPRGNSPQPTENIQKIIIDATERPCRRPAHARRQKRYYSGKNVIIP